MPMIPEGKILGKKEKVATWKKQSPNTFISYPWACAQELLSVAGFQSVLENGSTKIDQVRAVWKFSSPWPAIIASESTMNTAW